MQPARARHRLGAGPLALLVVVAIPALARGHGMRLPFDQWGGFRAETFHCQRVVAAAAAQCAATAWDARRACRRAELQGGVCDQEATQATVDAARIKALDAVDESCSERQAIELQYLGSFDLQADVIIFCRGWEAAGVSAVYGLFDVPLSPAERDCSEAAAAVADRLMHFVVRNRRQCMDRIASLPLLAPNRTSQLDVAADRARRAHDLLAARLATRCGAATFADLYGRTPGTFVTDLSARADCIGGLLYIQDAVLCPAPVCGNGIVELPEDCDDGNTAGGDACPATCEL
jgi:cysteine-rich repeat protein